MWLQSLSKRTPGASFLYLVITLVLASLIIVRELAEFRSVEERLWQDWVLLALPAFLVLLSALCNRVFVVSDIFTRNSLWPGYTYLLLAVLVWSSLGWPEALVHGSAGLLICYYLLKTHFNQDARSIVYNIGLVTGIAALFNSALFILVPFLLLSLNSMKPLSVREYLLYFLGIITPLYFLAGYCFLTDDFDLLAGIFSPDHWFRISSGISTWIWIRWSIVFLVFIALLFSSFMRFNSQPVKIRRISMAFLYLTGGLNFVAVACGFNSILLFYLGPVFAFFSTLLMLRISNKRRQEVIHIIFVSLIVAVVLVSYFASAT